MQLFNLDDEHKGKAYQILASLVTPRQSTASTSLVVLSSESPASVCRMTNSRMMKASLACGPVPETFTSFLEAACNQIRQASSNKPEISIRLLEMLRVVGLPCRIEKQLEAVLKQGELIASVALANAPTDADSEEIEERHTALPELKGES